MIKKRGVTHPESSAGGLAFLPSTARYAGDEYVIAYLVQIETDYSYIVEHGEGL
jgi:hypothetical protein